MWRWGAGKRYPLSVNRVGIGRIRMLEWKREEDIGGVLTDNVRLKFKVDILINS